MPKLFYVGVKGIIVKENKVLVIKHANKADWDLPGGRIDDGEDFTDGLYREMSEEIPGIKNIKIKHLIGVYNFPRDLEPGHGLFMVFFEVTATLPNRIQLSEEHDASLWATKEEIEALEPLKPGIKEAILKVI